MSKAFISAIIQSSAEITGVAASKAAADVIDAIVKELKKEGGFTLPSRSGPADAEDSCRGMKQNAYRSLGSCGILVHGQKSPNSPLQIAPQQRNTQV